VRLAALSIMRAALLLVVAFAGCDAAADPPQRSFTDKLLAVHTRMHARFAASGRAEQAIAIGDLERARAEARTIAELGEPDVLAEWQPYFVSVQAAARAIDDTRDLAAAARATAQLGAQCARCHAATAARITFPKEPAPDTGRRAPQMVHHRWAAARMWEGLVGRADDRWLDGARRLVTAPLTITAESDRLGIADDAARVRLYARRALVAPHSDRAAVYGELLATCAHCHYTIRDVQPTK
jgi:hypothetical protein